MGYLFVRVSRLCSTSNREAEQLPKDQTLVFTEPSYELLPDNEGNSLPTVRFFPLKFPFAGCRHFQAVLAGRGREVLGESVID